MKSTNISQVIELYRGGKSVPMIAKELEISPWVIYKNLHKLDIKMRKPHESNQIRFINSPNSYQLKNRLTKKQNKLWIAGLMLYWAEGSKRWKDCVDLANSDSEMIRVFMQFLREIYQVDERRFRVYLYCHNSRDIVRLIEYWSSITGLPKGRFTKPYVRTGFDKTKTDRMPNGMIHVRYNDQRLLKQILLDIQHLTNKLI